MSRFDYFDCFGYYTVGDCVDSVLFIGLDSISGILFVLVMFGQDVDFNYNVSSLSFPCYPNRSNEFALGIGWGACGA